MSKFLEKSCSADRLTIERGRRTVLWEASFSFPKGCLCGVIGPNGAGKSSLLKAMGGLIPISCGNFESHGSIAHVPQREEVDWSFPITVREVVLMGRFKSLGFLKWSRASDRVRADAVMKKLGILNLADRQISELSGGQQQRVFLARAIMQDADIYLLDEPFTGIDHTTEKLLIDLFKEWKKEGKTTFVVHHNLSNAAEIFDQILLLNGRVVAFGETNDVYTDENLAKTYSNAAGLLAEMLALEKGKKSGVIR